MSLLPECSSILSQAFLRHRHRPPLQVPAPCLVQGAVGGLLRGLAAVGADAVRAGGAEPAPSARVRPGGAPFPQGLGFLVQRQGRH